MKTSLKSILLITICTLASQAMAQSVQVGSASGLPGETVLIPVTFTAGPTPSRDVTAIQLILAFATTYDLVESTEAAPLCGADPAIDPLAAELCGWGGLGSPNYQIQLVKAAAFPTAVIARINFTIPESAVPGTVDPVTVQQFLIGGAGGPLDPPPEILTGTITVNEGPQPDYASNPAPASGVALNVIQNSADPSQNVLISNVGEATSTLTGSCSETSDLDGVFDISGDTAFSVLEGAAAAVVTVTCDSAGSIALHTGEMTCTHDGDGTTESSPATYALSCNITEGPQAAYSDALSPDPLNLVAVEEGDANPTGTVTVSNTGDDDTTLTGTCSYSGDAEMSLANGAFSLGQSVSNVATLTCNASAEGNYSGSISCTHDAGNVGSPVIHAVTCDVGPPGDAVYSSVKAPGGVYDLTPPGDPVPVGTVIPTQDLVITNNPPEANDRELVLLNCGFSAQPLGSTPQGLAIGISATEPGSPLAPNASTTVTFSCDSSQAGDFSDVYSCDYDVDGDGASDGTAAYPVNCVVREAESEVTLSPESGGTVTIVAPLGGFGQGSVVFNEILDEGVNASLDDCYLDDETYFSIVSPASFPQPIPADGSLSVVVEGMGTADGQPTGTTLYCTYTDSENDGTTVSWTFGVVVQTAAIPTLSTWGLALMILTLLGLGGIVSRRKELS